MRKRIFGRRLGRNTNERKALFRSLMTSLVFYGRIRTSEAKAKSIKGEVEKLVTRARKNGENAKSEILSRLANEKATDKLIKEITPLFANRPGGYTRIIRLAPRVKDGARMVLLSWVETVTPTSFREEKRNKNKKKAVPKVEKKAVKKESKAKKTTKK
jgi:large subunit ribosomal protein L17